MNDTTPIGEVVKALALPADCLSLVGVRTLGDLKTVLERGEVEKGLAVTIGKVLGNVGKA